MKITVSITVQDYVYQFYQKVSQEIGDGRTTEEIMSSALLAYAGFLAQNVIEYEEDPLPN